jgi:hypothetical protein
LGAVILLASMRGITAYNRVGALAHKFFALLANFFATSAKPQVKLQPPTCGGDAFDMELIKNHRFGSSGLNLAFEELLLGASLHTLVEGTRSDPRQSGF